MRSPGRPVFLASHAALAAALVRACSFRRCERLFRVVRARMVGAWPQIMPVVLQVKRDGLVIRPTHTQACEPVSRAMEECHSVPVQGPAKTATPIRWEKVEEVHVSYRGITPEPIHFSLSNNGVTLPDVHTTARHFPHPLREPHPIPFAPSPVRVHCRGRSSILRVKAFVRSEATEEGIRSKLGRYIGVPLSINGCKGQSCMSHLPYPLRARW